MTVDGDLFCLQCGELVRAGVQSPSEGLKLEETVDPLLRRAITDVENSRVVFTDPEKVAVQQIVNQAASNQPAPGEAPKEVLATPIQKKSFISLHRIVMPTGQTALASTSSSLSAASPGAKQELTQPTPLEPADSVPGVAPQVVMTKRHTALFICISAAIILLFGAANLAAGLYYADRVYPGVRVNNLAVGGWSFEQLHQRLAAALPQPSLSAVVAGRTYPLDISGVGAVSSSSLERDVRQSGKATRLPLLGVFDSWSKSPLVPSYELSDDSVSRAVLKLSGQVDRAASNAIPLVLGTNVTILADKPGTKLDPLAASAAIKAAYGHAQTVAIDQTRVAASVTADAYGGDIAAAQSVIGTTVSVKIKKQSYAPTPSQIAEWLIFYGPGKGVGIDPAAAANFVAGIPGAFDRSAALSGLLAALNTRHSTNLIPSTKHITGNIKPPSAAPVYPLITYGYCLDERSSGKSGIGKSVNSVLGSNDGWALGGRIHFVLIAKNCNFMLSLASADGMAALDPACSKQSTCRIHNNLSISDSSWANPPAGWVQSLDSYRAELINHVLGQWLGFDHPGCSSIAGHSPVLTAPSITFNAGCSPKWYVVPAELQDTKVLAGF